MRDRLLTVSGGLLRLVLVGIAFLLAIGSVGLSAVRGFCPDTSDAAGVTVAAPAALTLATVVDTEADDPEQDGAPTEDGSATDEPATDGDADGDAGADADGDAGGTAGDDDCPDGARRCLPPLISSVLLVGEPACNDQAGAELRGRLVPAFVGSTVLLAAAWGLRPGGRVDQLLRR